MTGRIVWALARFIAWTNGKISPRLDREEARAEAAGALRHARSLGLGVETNTKLDDAIRRLERPLTRFRLNIDRIERAHARNCYVPHPLLVAAMDNQPTIKLTPSEAELYESWRHP